MSGSNDLYLFVTLLTVALAVLLASIWLRTPLYTPDRGGRITLLVALFILPVLVAGAGMEMTMARSSTTDFCLSCHEMKIYGKSLLNADTDAIPALHFQYNYVPQDHACYTCHTNYAMFGSLRTKPDALRHLWGHYTGNIPKEMKLFAPFKNANCLHCHRSARSFREEDEHHSSDAPMAKLLSGEVSCLTAGCHDVTHDVAEDASHRYWYASYLTDAVANMPPSITSVTQGEPR